MRTRSNQGTEFSRRHARLGTASRSSRSPIPTVLGQRLLMAVCIAILSHAVVQAAPQEGATKDAPKEAQEVKQAEPQQEEPTGKVIGIKNVCVHVLKLKETLKLYQDILGFKLDKSVTLHGKGIEGMVVREMRSGSCLVHLSLPAPEYSDTVGPIGNTNHNHFMLLVDDIVPICDKLKAAGYALENENYAKEKWSFFTGPNGEVVGLTEYK